MRRLTVSNLLIQCRSRCGTCVLVPVCLLRCRRLSPCRHRHYACEGTGRAAISRLQLFAELFDIFDDTMSASEKADNPYLIINYGESLIVQKEIDRTILRDAAKAGISLILAAIMLRLGTGSFVLTVSGVVQIVVRRPFDPVIHRAWRGQLGVQRPPLR